MRTIKGNKLGWGKRVLVMGLLASVLAGTLLVLSPGESSARVIEKGMYTYKPQLNVCGIPRNGDCYVIIVLP